MALKALELFEMLWLRDPGGRTWISAHVRDTQMQRKPVELGQGGRQPGRASRRGRSLLPQGHRDLAQQTPAHQVPVASVLLPGKRLARKEGAALLAGG